MLLIAVTENTGSKGSHTSSVIPGQSPRGPEVKVRPVIVVNADEQSGYNQHIFSDLSSLMHLIFFDISRPK